MLDACKLVGFKNLHDVAFRVVAGAIADCLQAILGEAIEVGLPAWLEVALDYVDGFGACRCIGLCRQGSSKEGSGCQCGEKYVDFHVCLLISA